MLRILYDEIANDDSLDDISEHNMMLSDLHFNTETLRHSAYGWINSDSSRNFQDLEKLFRKKNFNTYLIAKKITIENGFVLKTPNNNVDDLLYECYFSCKPKEFALQEVLDNYIVYDENFENLAKSGNVCINIDKNDMENNENSLIKKLMNNKIKLTFKKLTPKESIEQMSEDIIKTTGNKPTIHIIGKLNDDSPIMAFLVEDCKVASNIAWSLQKENGETIYKLIDLNEYYAKNKLTSQ